VQVYAFVGPSRFLQVFKFVVYGRIGHHYQVALVVELTTYAPWWSICTGVWPTYGSLCCSGHILCSFLGFKSFILVTHYVAAWVTSLQYIKAYVFNKKKIESGNWTFGLLRERIGLLLPQSEIKCYMSACTWPNSKVKFPRYSDANCKLLLGVLGPQINEQNGLKVVVLCAG